MSHVMTDDDERFRLNVVTILWQKLLTTMTQWWQQPQRLLCPAPTGRGIKRWCASDVWRLSRTSGLSREEIGLGRLKLAQR